MNLSPPLGVLAGVVARPIMKGNQNFVFFKHLYISNIYILGILLGDFLDLEGVFLVLSPLVVGVFPDVLLVKEQPITFFDEFKLRLTLKNVQSNSRQTKLMCLHVDLFDI